MSLSSRLLLVLLCVLCAGFDWGSRLPRLRRDLADGDPAVRREAVRALALLPVADTREDVLAALADVDATVRLEAAHVAGRTQLPGAAEIVMDWLDDPDARMRAEAIATLSQLGTQTATPKILRALGDVEGSVREQAVRALGRVEEGVPLSALSARLLDEEPAVRRAAAQALARHADDGAVMALVGHVEDSDPSVRAAVLTALGELGDPLAVTALIAALGDEDREVRLRAALALGRIADERAVRQLVRLSQGTDLRLARAAVAALAGRAEEPARAALIAALSRATLHDDAIGALLAQARDDDARDALLRQVAHALDQAPQERTATATGYALGVLMQDAPSELPLAALLRAVAADRGRADILLAALAATGAEAAALPIFTRLDDDDERVRAAAFQAAEIYLRARPGDGRAADPLLGMLARTSGGGPLPSAATEPAQTDAAQLRRRIRLIALLGATGAARALPRLLAASSAEDPRERLAAVAAIGRLGVSEGAASLLPMLDDADARVRFEVARAVGRSAGASVVDGLIEPLDAARPTDRHARLRALGGVLGRLGSGLSGTLASRVRARLLAFSAHRDARLAAAALDALARWGDAEALRQLARMPRSSAPALRYQRAWVLALSAREEAVALPRAALARSGSLEAAAAWAGLGERRGRAVVDLVIDAVAERPFPEDAAASFALVRLARRGVFNAEDAPRLCPLLARRHPATRANVLVALAALGVSACPDADPERLLEHALNARVRAAAARWLHASGSARAAAALRDCLTRAEVPAVHRACRSPELPALGPEADVYAYAPDGSRLLPGALVAITLGDSSQWVCPADALAHLRLSHAPEGAMRLWLPEAVALEP